MKLTMLLIFAVLMQVSAATLAQRVTMQQRTATLKEFLDQVNRQTGYSVIFNASQVKNQTIEIYLKDTPLPEALDQALEHTNLDYTIENKTVVIHKKEPTLLDKIKTAIGAPITITAKVYDELGQPMPGVNVRIKDTQNGTTTDSKGNFSISVPDDNTVLIFSFIGYDTQELAAKDIVAGSVITLRVAENNLQEVVISKGYYDEKRELSTGDITVVSGKQINEQPVSDPILALEGRVPGLNIEQTSGIPGSYSTISIRGQNSIANGNDPLYIIDGVPFNSQSMTSQAFGGGALGQPYGVSNFTGGNTSGVGMSPFNSLNPSDIENIEILKDADATAIYGSRGANGVILITTKKGKAGKTRFDLNVYSGAGEVDRMMPLLNTQQYLEMRREAFANDGKALPSIGSNPSDKNFDINGFWDTTRYTNWEKVLIGNTESFTNIQGSLSGGNANTQFVIGGGYSNQGTVYPGSYTDQKASAHISITHSSDDQRFHAQLAVNYVNDNSNVPSFDLTSSIFLAPDAPPVHDAYGNLNWQLLNGTATFQNPLSPASTQANATTNNLISSLNLAYNILPGLVISSNFGYNKAQMNQSILRPSTYFAPPSNIPANASNSFATTDFSTCIIEPQLDFKKKVGNGQFDALIGTSFQANIQNSISQTAYGFTSDALISDPQAANNVQLGNASYSLYHYQAIYGRIGYDWDEKYLVNLTARRDGSSRFGPGKQFGNFGAVGAGWVFSKEKFVRDAIPFLSFGKLRASYGTTGNDQIGNYQYLSTYKPGSLSYQGVSGLSPTGLTNPYYAWEVVKKLEGGIEMGFLEDRINLEADYFRDRTGNQLVGLSLPEVAGYSSVEYNLPAVVQNTGFEFTANTINIKVKNFKWTTAVNLTIPNNKLVAFPGLANFPAYQNAFVIGEPLSILKLYHSTGVNPQTGIYSFTTANANGLPSSPQDNTVIEPITQKYYGGISNSLSYKGFQLDFLFQYVNQLGHNYLSYISSPGIINNNAPTYVLSRWQQPGDVTDIQRFGETITTVRALYSGLRYSDAAISDASFLRLKNVAFSYQFSNKGFLGQHLSNPRIYIQCQNLLTVTRYQGLDPETQGLNLPPLRMVTAGFQVGIQ